MRTNTFITVVVAGIIGSTHGLEINKTDPAALEMCPAVDGFAEVSTQIAGESPGWFGLAQTLLEGGPTKAKAARGPPPRAIKKGGEGHDEDEGESEGEGEHHAQVASQGETQPPKGTMPEEVREMLKQLEERPKGRTKAPYVVGAATRGPGTRTAYGTKSVEAKRGRGNAGARKPTPRELFPG